MSKIRDELGGLLTKLELRTLARNYLQAGGTREAWVEAIDEAAATMPGGDRLTSVPRDHSRHVSSQQPIMSEADHSRRVPQDPRLSVHTAHEPTPGGDRAYHVLQDQSGNVPVGKPILGGGHPASVHSKDQGTHSSPQNHIAGGRATSAVSAGTSRDVPPAREPSSSYIRAAAESRKATAKLQLELKTTSTGKVWGAVRPREFTGMIRDGDIAWAIREAFGPFNEKQESMELREFLPDAVFKKALVIAEATKAR